MAEAVNDAGKNIKRDLVIVRVVAIVFLVAGVVLALMTALLGLGRMAYVGDEGALVGALFWTTLLETLFMLVLAVLGLRAAHNRFRARPFAVFSALLVAFLAGGFAMSFYASTEDALSSSASVAVDVALIVLAFVGACAGFGLDGYNRRHPADEVEPPAPEHVPDVAPVSTSDDPAINKKESIMPEHFSPATPADEPLELRLESKLMSITRKMDVLDAHDNVVYRVHSAAVSINDRTYIEDAEGNEVANIHAKVVSIHGVYYVEMADGVKFELSRELLHLNDVINIDALGWQLRSRNMLAFDFDVCDGSGKVVASCARKVFSLRDTYTVQVFDRAHADEIVAIFVIMKHIVENRTAEASDGAAHAAN